MGIVGGGVESNWVLSATNRPIMPTPGDYDDGEIGGMKIGRGNRTTRRENLPQRHFCPSQNPT
jgi:hypothetical protein